MSRPRRILLLFVVASLVPATALSTAAGASVQHKKKKITCASVLKPAEIQTVVGASVTAGKPFKTAGQIGCNWSNAADEVSLSVFISRRLDQYDFSKAQPPADYTIEPIAGIGQDAFIVRSPTGSPVVIWVLAKKASFSLANNNVDKDDAALQTEITTLATAVAGRLK